MRFLLRYAIFALLGGLALGLALRAAGARRRFGTLCLLALLPLVGHAVYLGFMMASASTGLSATWPYAAIILIDLLAALLLVRRWHRVQMLWAALIPTVAVIVYAAVASIMLTLTLGPGDPVPSALVGAVLALVTLAMLVMLLVLVPGEPRIELPSRAESR